jgi:hypothetical protein
MSIKENIVRFRAKGNTLGLNISCITNKRPLSMIFPKPSGTNWNDRGIIINLGSEVVSGLNVYYVSSDELVEMDRLFTMVNICPGKAVRLTQVSSDKIWVKPLTEDFHFYKVVQNLQEAGII